MLDAFHRRVGLGIGTSTADTLSLSAVIHLLKTMQAVGYDTALFRSVALLFIFWFGFCHILNLIQHFFGGTTGPGPVKKSPHRLDRSTVAPTVNATVAVH